MQWIAKEPPRTGDHRARTVFAWWPITNPDTRRTYWLEWVTVCEALHIEQEGDHCWSLVWVYSPAVVAAAKALMAPPTGEAEP